MANLLLMTLIIQIAKFKFCQYQMRAIFAKFNARQSYLLCGILPWFGQHDVVDASIFTGQCPRQEMAKVLEHVLSEERSVGSHHPRHGVQN